MQAYFETEVFLPVNHHLNLKLPDEIPAGRVRIAVIYEKEENMTEKGNLSHFLSTLPLNVQGRSNEDIKKKGSDPFFCEIALMLCVPFSY